MTGPYNGFPGTQRDKAQAWLRVQWASGALKKPSQCVACGKKSGRIDAHAEDYSEPFAGGKTDEFHLCFACHMAVHCRFRNPDFCATYVAQVRKGYVAPLYGWPAWEEAMNGAQVRWIGPGVLPGRDVLGEILQMNRR